MILGNAEKHLGFDNPVGVGQRPRQLEQVYGGNFEDFFRHGNMGTHQQHFHHHHHHHGHQQQFPRGPNNHSMYNNQQRRAPAQNYAKPWSPSPSKGNGNGSNYSAVESRESSSPVLSQSNTPGKMRASEAGEGQDEIASAGSECCFFVMKCNNQRNLDTSQRKSLWATSTNNEFKLNKAFQSGKTVYLVYSVQGSGHFQGFAKMTSAIGKEKSPDFMAPGLSGVFSVEWQKRANLPFQMTQHLLNPWNENRKVQISRDGQEIEPSVGASLLKLWDHHPSLSKRPQSGLRQQQRSGTSSSRQRNQAQHQQPSQVTASGYQNKSTSSSSNPSNQSVAHVGAASSKGSSGSSESSKQGPSSVMILQRTSPFNP